MNEEIINSNIAREYPLPSPNIIRKLLPLSEKSTQTILKGRKIIREILDGRDRRLFLVIGPCSIHDPDAAIEYAGKLKRLADEVQENFFLAMRVYFEKPRTAVGWKGFINDPFLDESHHIEEALKRVRLLLLQITEMGIPTATEALDVIVPQYISDLICWYAIGARTVGSQIHRELASGLSTPVGFKNSIDGDIETAVNAIKFVSNPNHFLGINTDGRTSVFKTRGNAYSHIVLRGGSNPNYDRISIARCEEALGKAGIRKKIMIDCSHGNSNKDHRKQPAVFQSCIEQIKDGSTSLMGLMLESNLREGNQTIPPRLTDIRKLEYGVSVTDKCLDWNTTEQIVLRAFSEVRAGP